VRQSIARIKASPFIPRQDNVRGFVYEVESGRLREVSQARPVARRRSGGRGAATEPPGGGPLAKRPPEVYPFHTRPDGRRETKYQQIVCFPAAGT
jgi:hypothetical protein